MILSRLLFYTAEMVREKTTALNIIAETLRLERDTLYNRSSFFEDYTKLCSYQVFKPIPQTSRIVTSDDVFDYMLNLRNLNEGIDKKREVLFKEYLEAKYAHFQVTSLDDYEQLKKCAMLERKQHLNRDMYAVG